MKDVAQAIADLKRQIADLQSKLTILEQAQEIMGGKRGRGAATTKRTRQSGKMSVADAVEQTLKAAGGPLAIPDILQKASELTGREISRATLNTMFNTNKERFVRTGRGMYSLPEAPRPEEPAEEKGSKRK